MDKLEVETKDGKFVLRKPKAGARNKAAAESDFPGQGIKASLFYPSLLPECVEKHPFGVSDKENLKKSLENMDFQEYDLLIDGIKLLMEHKEGDVEKKLEKPSESKANQSKEK